MRRPLRAALIGCGGISERHGRGFSIPDRCELVAACDLNPENLERIAGRLGISQRYTNPGGMLDREKPDIVAISTWPGSHADLTLECAARGVRGILCEKPMAVSPAECDRMIAACQASGTLLGIGHHYRFQPSLIAARNLVEEGCIGPILMVHVATREGLANNASHLVDLARFFLGDPALQSVFGTVERLTDRYERGIPIEDCAIGRVQFDHPAPLFLESDLGEEKSDMLLVGEKGVLRVRRSEAFLQTPDGWRALSGEGEFRQHTAFLDVLERNGESPGYESSGENGRAVIEGLCGLFLSARDHRQVTFPLNDREYPIPGMIASGQWAIEIPGAYDIRGATRWRKER